MPHNRAPSSVFRFCSLLAIVPVAVILAGSHGKDTVGGGFPSGDGGVSSAQTKTGIDVLERENFAPLRGKRIGLITNQTGIDSAGQRTIDVLAHAAGVELVALFSPEHGIRGGADEAVPNASDPATGLPIYSLYGPTRRPTPEMLATLDALVFDIQDAGVRFYTYITTMGYAMEEAAKHGLSFFVLDRPDILGGEIMEGPVLDADQTSFVAYFPMPVRLAMTLGELAEMFNAEKGIGAHLEVIKMQDWLRNETYDQTGLAWVAPSPNLRTLRAAFLYPGIEILQAGGVSVGRGTDSPFERFGAPWIQAETLVAELDRRKIPGVSFAPTRFTPDADLYKGQACEGASVRVTDRVSFRAMLMGLEIIEVLQRLYPQHFQIAKTIELLGSQSTVEQLERGDEPRTIIASWGPQLDHFRSMRRNYLLYP